MPHRNADYEAFLASIVDGVRASQREITSLCFGRNNKPMGASGQHHQVDVSFVDRSFPETTLVLIECKRYNNRRLVSVDVAKILKYNADDIVRNPDYPDKVLMILVTTHGFQSGTKRIAEHENIRLHVVNHGPPFGFEYENIIFLGMSDPVSVTEKVKIELGPSSWHRI